MSSVIWDEFLPPHWRVHAYGEVRSTMEKAKEYFDEVTPEAPLLVIARSQTAGRGRQGRTWNSARGGFYATYGFASQRPVAALSGLPLVVGVVLRRVLAGEGIRLELKWPNDLLAPGGKKAGGILVEVVTRGALTVALVGIGINLSGVLHEVPEAISLEALNGKRYAPSDIAQLLSEELRRAWREFEQQGFSAFRSAWEAGACWRGEEVEVQQGSETIAGVFEGVSISGSMLLHTAGGAREIVTAEALKVRRSTR